MDQMEEQMGAASGGGDDTGPREGTSEMSDGDNELGLLLVEDAKVA